MITCSNIGFGNQLGAQMTDFADLYYIAKENGQTIQLLDDFKEFRRGYQFVSAFDFPQDMLEKETKSGYKTFYNKHFSATSGDWKKNFSKIYKSSFQFKLDMLYYRSCMKKKKDLKSFGDLKGGVTCDSRLLELEPKNSYDIKGGFGTIKEWDKYRSDILDIYKFKDETKTAGDDIWREKVEKKNEKNLTTCSIHFRRTDYLLIASLNLSDDYYKKAMEQFDKENTLFVVLSDDVDAVRDLDYLQDCSVVFMDRNPAIIDMYLMTKCDSNIVANSSFSFWGAYLKKEAKGKVVCPHDFIGNSVPELQYMNGNWYPNDWVALDIR